MKLTFDHLFAHPGLKSGIFKDIQSIVLNFEEEIVTFICEDIECCALFCDYNPESNYHRFHVPDPSAVRVIEFIIRDDGTVFCFNAQDGIPDYIREKMRYSLFQGINSELI